jgi:hypothetical protein
VADKPTDPAVALLAANLSKLPHPQSGADLRLVMFDGAGPEVTKMVAEAIVSLLRKNGHMPRQRSTKGKRR